MTLLELVGVPLSSVRRSVESRSSVFSSVFMESPSAHPPGEPQTKWPCVIANCNPVVLLDRPKEACAPCANEQHEAATMQNFIVTSEENRHCGDYNPMAKENEVRGRTTQGTPGGEGADDAAKTKSEEMIQIPPDSEAILWPAGRPKNPKRFEAMWFDGLYYPADITDTRLDSPRYRVAWKGKLPKTPEEGGQSEGLVPPYGQVAWVWSYRPETTGDAVMCRRGTPYPTVNKVLDFSKVDLQKALSGEASGAL